MLCQFRFDGNRVSVFSMAESRALGSLFWSRLRAHASIFAVFVLIMITSILETEKKKQQYKSVASVVGHESRIRGQICSRKGHWCTGTA